MPALMKKNQSNIIFIFVLVLAVFFIKCPIEKMFGIPCPGCMMTTAFYYLIQGDFVSATYFNPAIYVLLTMSLPLVISYRRNKKIFNILLTITLVMWFMIYVYRFMTIFPKYPMPYVKDNVISNLMNLWN